uniref:Cell division cycle protein 16 n=1 Tax=Aceria tosichella TaxID=561515 RepID=A0A6G1SG12_9ACAR
MAQHNMPASASSELINNLRATVKSFIHCQDYQSASFWAEKVMFLTNDPDDTYERARCLYNLKEYHRAAHTIRSRDLHQTNLACLYLAAQCHFMEKDYKEANQLLDSPLIIKSTPHNSEISMGLSTPTTLVSRHSSRIHNQQHQQHHHHQQQQQVSSATSDKSISRMLGAIYLLKGKLHECNDNRQMAQSCFKEALVHDIFCFEAYTSLTRHHMLTIEEETTLLNELNLDESFRHDPEMGQFIKLFYSLRGKKYHKPSQPVIPPELEYLSTNVDVETALAERHYFNCDYHSAYELSCTILEKDAHHLECLPVYISSLMEIDKPTQLFNIAHQLVDLYPESAVSWFAVGCYYLLINKVEPARRYLSKATTLDNVFGPAWLVYGHSFAVEREHDQAMAAYFRAYHLMRGCHLPLLFIGVEYNRGSDCKLAKKFLDQARKVAPEDPFVLHEYGVVYYRNKEFKPALECFKEAEKILRQANATMSSAWTNSDRFKQKWEPLLNNIGHTLRQLGRYDEAIEYHNKALTLVQATASTYSALGFLYYLKEDWDKALEYLNNALSIRFNDSISTSLLEKTIPKYNQALKESLAAEKVPPVDIFQDSMESLR